MSNEDTLIIIAVAAFGILVYAVAFGAAYANKQNITPYVVLLVIQLLFALYEMFGYTPGGSDAAGSGMAHGYFHLILLAVQVILTLTVAVISIVRWKYAFIPVFMIASIIIGAYWLIERRLYDAPYRTPYSIRIGNYTVTVEDEPPCQILLSPNGEGLSFDSYNCYNELIEKRVVEIEKEKSGYQEKIDALEELEEEIRKLKKEKE
jgi:hypothetical protein